jgi:membrane carboxypeptidase/penicillin-binding protein
LGVSGRIVETLLKLGDSKRWRSLVKHRVAVRADWNQVPLRVYSIANANVSELAGVMNVNETATKLAIGRCEVEAAHAARRAEVGDAGTPSGSVALESIDGNAPHRPLPKALGRHAAVLALQRRPGGGTTTLDPGIQFELERLVRAHQATLPEGTQIAAAVVEISTGNLTALQGSTDFDDAFVGQVNGALAWRSPGSTLKPFVYAAAFEIRRLAPESFVHDVRIDRAGWSPRNFDGEYRGRVTVSEALRESLNIPAIHVAETLGLNRCAGYLESVGVQWRGAAADAAGAGLVVGAAEVRLLDLVNAYATLGRGGVHRPVRFFHDESGESRRVISGNVCRVIDEILSSTTRLPAGMEGRTSETAPWFMWKTGTSSGRRDAWAVGHNRRYALGVWVGRFYGTGRPEYVGGKVAEPLLARLFGLSAIQNLEAQRAPDAIQVLNPLPPPKELANELRILSPSDSTVFIATSATANIYARANQDDGVMWFLDGARVEEASLGPLSVPRWRHRLLCVSEVGASAGVEFIVR